LSSLVARLSRHQWVHHAVAALSIYRWTGPLLARFPVHRRLRPSGLVYRITSLDQFGIADEMFTQRTYDAVLAERPIDTFIDLGCNAGWFALWLEAELPNRERSGLLVDANQFIVAEAEWHLKQNQLEGEKVVFGAVGLPPDSPSAVFHILPSASQSSLLDYEAGKQMPLKGRIKDVTVPAVSVRREWKARFGERPVDLMKIDIEGNELDFIRYEGEFVKASVRIILLEWHKWHTGIAELDTALAGIGFARRGIYHENEMTGIALYKP
jgi:FkbM family methyltransferase